MATVAAIETSTIDAVAERKMQTNDHFSINTRVNVCFLFVYLKSNWIFYDICRFVCNILKFDFDQMVCSFLRSTKTMDDLWMSIHLFVQILFVFDLRKKNELLFKDLFLSRFFRSNFQRIFCDTSFRQIVI